MGSCIECTMWDGSHRGVACRMNAVVAPGYRGPCSEFRQAGLGAVLHTRPTSKTRAPSGPNKTEADYQRTYLRGIDARYEALTFRMANGHRYTPDWVVFEDGKPIACHECKGGYALHSQQRARLAFDQATVEFTGLVWVWAVKGANGWEVSRCGVSHGVSQKTVGTP